MEALHKPVLPGVDRVNVDGLHQHPPVLPFGQKAHAFWLSRSARFTAVVAARSTWRSETAVPRFHGIEEFLSLVRGCPVCGLRCPASNSRRCCSDTFGISISRSFPVERMIRVRFLRYGAVADYWQSSHEF
jgi:hypothetical protein